MAVYTMTAYPMEVELGAGETAVIRPMLAGDEEALLEFFLRVPDEDRFYLKEDVTSPAIIRRWSEGLDDGRLAPPSAGGPAPRVLAGRACIRDDG